MIRPSLRSSSGLLLTGREGFLFNPTWEGMSDGLNVNSEPLETKSSRVVASSPIGPTFALSSGQRNRTGLEQWNGTMTFVWFNAQERAALFDAIRKWVGMVYPFWLSSWMSDFKVTQDVDPEAGGSIRVEDNGFEYQAGRYGICIYSAPTYLDVMQITGYSPGVLLVSAIPQRVRQKDIYAASVVRRVRCGSASLTFEYASAAVGKVTITFSEVFDEGAYDV